MNCQVKIGIFSLRECGEAQVETCANCQIHLCKDHIRITESNSLCPECEIKLYPDSSNAEKYNKFSSGQEDNYHSSYYFYQRNQFYQTNDYTPFESDDYVAFDYEDSADNSFDDNEIKGSITDS